ncbi:MAG: D-alanyl-D-alanine carboxypeptidase [Lachnospiraceae bacterium]|nr:D-alanyl-D-alanine carboxypeptidase [Lachnospiraceae bacterium]
MKRHYTYFGGILLAAVLMTGCGKGDNSALSYTPERFAALCESIPEERLHAAAFADDLCVITGEEPQSDPAVTAESAALFSLQDGRVLFQKNPFARMNPASITKIMTALIAIRSADLTESVTVGQETVITESGASLCHIAPGETLTMEELLYGLMLPSGNDAGAAIAVHMAGSMEAFSDRMNEEARALGATGTHFVNSHGLTDEQHYTTAYDLYLIFQEALKEPEFKKIIGTTEYTAEYLDAQGNPKTQIWKNSNQYLNGKTATPEGLHVVGGKTGTTMAAGSCLIMDSEDAQNQDYISVVLKADSRASLYENMTNIIQKIAN